MPSRSACNGRARPKASAGAGDAGAAGRRAGRDRNSAPVAPIHRAGQPLLRLAGGRSAGAAAGAAPPRKPRQARRRNRCGGGCARRRQLDGTSPTSRCARRWGGSARRSSDDRSDCTTRLPREPRARRHCHIGRDRVPITPQLPEEVIRADDAPRIPRRRFCASPWRCSPPGRWRSQPSRRRTATVPAAELAASRAARRS